MSVFVDHYNEFLPEESIYSVMTMCVENYAHTYREYLYEDDHNDWLHRISSSDWLYFLKGMLLQINRKTLNLNQNMPMQWNLIRFAEICIKFHQTIEFLFNGAFVNEEFLIDKGINNVIQTNHVLVHSVPLLTELLMILTADDVFLNRLSAGEKFYLYKAAVQIVEYAPYLELLAGQFNNISNLQRAMMNKFAYLSLYQTDPYLLLEKMLIRIFLPVKIAQFVGASLPPEQVKRVVNGGPTDYKEGTTNYTDMMILLKQLAANETLNAIARQKIQKWLNKNIVKEYYELKKSSMHEG